MNSLKPNLQSMTVPELESLNRDVVAELRHRDRERQRAAASAFRIGQLVEWDSKYGGTAYGRIEAIHTKSAKVKEMTADGVEVARRWTVSPSLLRAWDGKPPQLADLRAAAYAAAGSRA